jgi:hypothetical protein
MNYTVQLNKKVKKILANSPGQRSSEFWIRSQIWRTTQNPPVVKNFRGMNSTDYASEIGG